MKSEVKHSETPWRIGDNGSTIFGPPRPEHGCPKIVASIGYGVSIGPNERKANARLIAAAPDLLSACQYALDAFYGTAWRTDDPVQANAIAKIQNAINKAVGIDHTKATGQPT